MVAKHPIWLGFFRSFSSKCSVFIDFGSWHAHCQLEGGGFISSMNSNKINRSIEGMALIFALAFGLVLVSGTDVNAQGRSGRDDSKNDSRRDDNYGKQQNRGGGRDYRDDDDYRRNDNGYYTGDNDRVNGRDRNGNQSTQFAYKRGYQAGQKQAREDARNRNRNNGRYNNGTYGGYGNNSDYGNGNHNGWGDSGAFQQAYREGYNRGYQDGLNRNRNSGYNNNIRRQSGIGRILGLPF